MSTPQLRSVIVHQLNGVDVGGGEILAPDVIASIPADDLTRRILNGDYIAVPEEDNPGRVWDASDLLRAVMAARGVTLEGAPGVEVPTDDVATGMKLEASKSDDDSDLDAARLAAAAALQDAEMKAAAEQEAAEKAAAEQEAAEKAAAEKTEKPKPAKPKPTPQS